MKGHKIDSYVENVLDHMVVDEGMKERIKKDLYQHINEVSTDTNIDIVLRNMGEPKEVAKEFMDTIYQDKEDVIEKLIQERTLNKNLLNNAYEYKSKIHIFGIPLVHINLSRVKLTKNLRVAKGIIALGDIALGVLAIGGITAGVISLGGIGLGLLTFAGIALGGVSFGGVSVGALAIGGVAIGLGSMGGVAIGNIAIGGYARGTVAVGGKAVGDYIISGGSEGPNYNLSDVNATKEEVYNLIKTAYPQLSSWIIRIFTILFK